MLPCVRGAFEDVTGSRTSISLKISRNREIWAGPQLLPRWGVEDSLDRVVADAEQEPEGFPFSEHNARGPIDGDLPRHQIGAWMIVEGRGNNGGKGFGV